MSNIIPYEFPESGQPVRVVLVDAEAWWVAADIAVVLELGNVRSSLALLDEDEKGVHSMDTPGGAQLMATVSEAGLYSLILRSRKPQAHAFKRWITHEVIPSIRKTGRYEVAPRELSNRDLALMVIAEADRADLAERRVAELEPKADAFDVIASAKGDFSLRDSAFILNRDPGIKTGQNRLMDTLRDLRMVDGKGLPYAAHQTHLTERVRTYDHPVTGEKTLAKRPQIRITVAGLRYLHKKLGGCAPLRFDQLPFAEGDAA